jgi:hypothetical protein
MPNPATDSGCDCFALETCERCYDPSETEPGKIRHATWDLPIFGWAWTGDGKDRDA